MTEPKIMVPAELEKLAVASSAASILPAVEVSSHLETGLVRMFRDPYQLEKPARTALIAELRQSVAQNPHVVELRVLLGMALCVDLQAQEALAQLRDAAAMAPHNFVAHYKLGELLMRLRICDQAASETSVAARLAGNPVQIELARNQAAKIRTMQREGIERGGWRGFWSRTAHWRDQLKLRAKQKTLLAGSR